MGIAGQEIWLIKKYKLICYLNKNTVSAINLTFWHQNDTCEIAKFILRVASRPSFLIDGWKFFLGRSLGGPGAGKRLLAGSQPEAGLDPPGGGSALRKACLAHRTGGDTADGGPQYAKNGSGGKTGASSSRAVGGSKLPFNSKGLEKSHCRWLSAPSTAPPQPQQQPQ